MIESATKQAILDAQAEDEKAQGIPGPDFGVWNTPGPHVIGPWPEHPSWLVTEHLSDVLQAKDGTFGYEPATEPKQAPAGCTLVAKPSAVKWAEAVPLKPEAKPVEEKPIEPKGGKP